MSVVHITVDLEDAIRLKIQRIECELVAGTFPRLQDEAGSRRWHQGSVEALKWVLTQAHTEAPRDEEDV